MPGPNSYTALYEMSKDKPKVTSCQVGLKTSSIVLGLNMLDHGVISTPDPAYPSEVFDSHIQFKAAILRPDEITPAFHDRCVAEVRAVSLFFPGSVPRNVRICMAAWLGLFCAVDDILEDMPCGAKESLGNAIRMLKQPSSTDYHEMDQVGIILSTFRQHCGSFLTPHATNELIDAVYGVFQALMDEFRFRQGELPHTLTTYMAIRCRTIGLNPLFSLLRSAVCPDRAYSADFDKLQRLVCTVAGIQNDLVGLDKDLREGEAMNAVVVALNEKNGLLDEKALGQVVQDQCTMHNVHVHYALSLYEDLENMGNDNKGLEFAARVLGMSETHFKWVTSAKRYQVKEQ